MKRSLYLICIGTLALTLTAWGQPTKQARPAGATAHRTANVRATRPANTSAMRTAHRPATAPSRQRTYTASRTHANMVVNHNAQMRASRQRTNATVNRERNVAANRARNVEVNRNRNAAELRARNNLATNRERNVAANRARNVDVNPNRNAAAFRARNNLAGNGGRNFAYYRGRNVAINNNFHSAAFRGQQYAAFRNYNRQWHDRSWWRNHYNRIVFVNGGWYYWNAGYWFPAWGYAASAYYAFDGPIYGYNGLAPDRVTVDVQSQLQQDGYYEGAVDGVLGPTTREAIAAFQEDHGLAVTSVIDQPTLAALGVA
ncbi:MAG: peptidoglycan-binding protein [Candidatus Udaeobacter sp.]